MRHLALSSLVLTALLAVTGCSVSTTRAHSSVTPRGVSVADTATDPSWTPAEEWSFTTTETKNSRTPLVANALPAPNRQQIARGQVHEAY